MCIQRLAPDTGRETRSTAALTHSWTHRMRLLVTTRMRQSNTKCRAALLAKSSAPMQKFLGTRAAAVESGAEAEIRGSGGSHLHHDVMHHHLSWKPRSPRSVIYKAGDDLRKDVACTQIFRMMNMLWSKDRLSLQPQRGGSMPVHQVCVIAPVHIRQQRAS